MDLSFLSQDLSDAKTVVALAGAAVVGVLVGIKAVEWLELVIIGWQTRNDYLD